MLKITKRDGSPYWQITGSYQGERVRETTGCTDKAQAEKILAKRIREIDGRTVGKKTVSDAIQAYREGGGEAKYLDEIDEVLGHISLESITQEDIDRGAREAYGGYKRGDKGKPRKHSPSTIKRQFYTPLSAVLRYASKMRWMHLMEVASPEPRRPAPKWAEPSWFKELWKHCDPEMKKLTMFLCLTGCRIQECLDLEWADVNLKEKRAFIRKTKTGAYRTVRLPPSLVKALGQPQEGRVFAYRDRRQVVYFLKRACQKAKIPYLTTHQLGSHTFATWMRQYAGADVRDLLDTGRWADIQSAHHYTHTDVSAAAKKADILANLLK